MNFFIIHGVYGNPQENWFPWLKKELEKKDCEAIVPKFPTPIGQSLESWLRIFKKYEDKINSETILIGHSLGAAFILNYLEQSEKKVNSAYLVAGYHYVLENQFKNMNKTFVDKKFNWSRIIENCGKFFVIGSDNDEFIPEDATRQLALNLDAELHIIHNGGHLNSKAGYDKFPELLSMIKKII